MVSNYICLQAAASNHTILILLALKTTTNFQRTCWIQSSLIMHVTWWLPYGFCITYWYIGGYHSVWCWGSFHKVEVGRGWGGGIRGVFILRYSGKKLQNLQSAASKVIILRLWDHQYIAKLLFMTMLNFEPVK